MTEENLAAIEALADAATRLPWVSEHCHTGKSCWSKIVTHGKDPAGEEVWGCVILVWAVQAADADFIAACRAGVPALVAEVRRLRVLVGESKGAAT